MASPSFKFSPDEVASLLDGKVCARVESNRIFREGDMFDVEGATFRVLDVQWMTGRGSVSRVFRLEGCRSPSAFIKRLRLRLGEDAVSIGSIVYVHYFASMTELQNVSKSTED